ncbi:MAG: DUF4364 family protein [Defluviitaleaceae bacterium]|nr:DUF4364 family protein [Defluviitaleaceae bacterium]
MLEEKPKTDIVNIEKKLLILYLLDKMEIPLSNMQITQFLLEEEYMDYFEIQEALSDMVDAGYLDKTSDNQYQITADGMTPLEFFSSKLPSPAKSRINNYVLSNRHKIKKDFEVTANYFYDHVNNEFTVKCGAYEDRSMLIEVNVTVSNKEHARAIRDNWKSNVNELYGNILELLAVAPPGEEE